MHRSDIHTPRVRAAILDVISRTKGDLRANEARFIAELRAAVAEATTPAGSMLDRYRPDRHREHSAVFARFDD